MVDTNNQLEKQTLKI